MTTVFISHTSKDRDWAAAVREVLIAEGFKSLFLDFHPDDGIKAGADWEQTLWQCLHQSRCLVVLCTRHWLGSPWCVAEAMMARERGKKVFLLAEAELLDANQSDGICGRENAPRIPDFLKDTQFVRLSGITREVAHQRLIAGLKEALKAKDEFPLPERPYPGLMVFEGTDAAVFCGRDDEIAWVIETLHRRQLNNAKGFVVVLGASGCGKSSLVRAGVVPQLKRRQGNASNPNEWIVPTATTPGRGLRGLAALFADPKAKPGEAGNFAQLLEQFAPARETVEGRHQVASALQDLAVQKAVAQGTINARLLLVLDQLEEAFDAPENNDARALFALLVEATASPGSPIVVLATMRSDFLNAFQNFPGVADRYEPIFIDPMPASRFGSVIEEPADRFGLRLDPGLTQQLVEDTQHADALPLLAFTLRRLYERCRAEGQLTLQAYRDLFPPVSIQGEAGAAIECRGVAASISHTANQIMIHHHCEWADEDSRWIPLRTEFLRLVRLSDDGRLVRSRALQADMPEECKRIFSDFRAARLITSWTDQDEKRTEYLSFTHEAIFRVWDRLSKWIRDSRPLLELRKHIRQLAVLWDDAGRATDRIPRWNGELERAWALCKENGFEFEAREIAFLRACHERHSQEDRERRVREDLARARAILHSDPSRCLVSAVDIMSRSASEFPGQMTPAQSLLFDALERARESLVVDAHRGSVTRVLFNPSSGQILTAGEDGNVYFWNPSGAAAGSPLAVGCPIRTAALDDSGQWLATSDATGRLLLWDLQSLQHREIGDSLGLVSAIGFRPGHPQEMATYSDDGLGLWNVSAGSHRSLTVAKGEDLDVFLPGDPLGKGCLAFSSDGHRLVFGHQGVIWLYDFRTDSSALVGKHNNAPVTCVAFVPGGSENDVVSAQGWGFHPIEETLYFWDVSDETLALRKPEIAYQSRRELKAHHYSTVCIAIAPRQHLLASGGDDSMLHLVRLDSNDVVEILAHEIVTLAFGADETVIYTGGADGKLRAWTLNPLGLTGIEWDASGSDAESERYIDAADERNVISMDLRRRSNNAPAASSALYALGNRFDGARIYPRQGIALVEGGGLSQLFDLDAQPLTEAFAVPEGICGFALSPDRTTVATSSYWGMPSGGGFFTNVRLFDTLGVPITSFRWDRALIGRLWFSEDGLRLFGQCDKTGSVLVGPGGWRAAIALACDRLKNHPALREAGNRESQGASETCRAALASGH